jgi:hypothetical protein
MKNGMGVKLLEKDAMFKNLIESFDTGRNTGVSSQK